MPDKNTKRRGGRNPTGKPNPIDIHVGSRIRERRTLLGMSQSKLGDSIGLTFQQVQKYERGTNRVGSSRMYELARVLDVPVAYFFAEIAPDTASRAQQHLFGRRDRPADDERRSMTKRETLELVRAYYKVTDNRVRKRLFEMMKALGRAAV